ncbi:MipA/OmpV family protein [Paraburkholderia lacunae]|uniref:MipA/OmpV family protein n=1 Tax=Paraburkholderia lacunae TaxID=2211104 RepID=A0A370NC80_9BURK|nr:MipA/OmpV family protein [Paraburkholderia lacunae]RDK03200.1 MipA/OmpV family protein [Paraburkholderia lacunae]
MKKTFRREYRVLLSAAFALLYAGSVWADSGGEDSAGADDSGFTVLSNATNVTHWGLGVGAGVAASPYKNGKTKFSPIPLITFDNKWVHALGTTVDLKIGKWQNVSVALRGVFAIGDGYNNSDAPILNGMENRRGAFWYGPALAWKTAFGTLSGDYLLGGNKGQRAKIDFSKSFDYGNFSFEPHAGVEWLSSKYVNYYYGVRPSEVRAGRPAYTGRAAYEMSIGTRVDYKFTPHQMVILDVGVAHFSSGITNSPIVGRQYIPEARIGYVYQFK